jgi:hypothetical protein
MRSRDNSVVTWRAMGWTAGVQFPAEARFFSSPQCPDRLCHCNLVSIPSLLIWDIVRYWSMWSHMGWTLLDVQIACNESFRPLNTFQGGGDCVSRMIKGWRLILTCSNQVFAYLLLKMADIDQVVLRARRGGRSQWPITVAVQSKAWTVFARSNTVVVGSNPTRDMVVYVRLLCFFVVLYVGSGLAMGWFSVQGVLQTVYRIKKMKKLSRSKGL